MLNEKEDEFCITRKLIPASHVSKYNVLTIILNKCKMNNSPASK